jgi:hypothetical protein
MSAKPKKWPSYALSSLENAQSLFQDIDKTAKEAQLAIQAGREIEAIIILSDVREMAIRGVGHMQQAYTGNYADASPHRSG